MYKCVLTWLLSTWNTALWLKSYPCFLTLQFYPCWKRRRKSCGIGRPAFPSPDADAAPLAAIEYRERHDWKCNQADWRQVGGNARDRTAEVAAAWLWSPFLKGKQALMINDALGLAKAAEAGKACPEHIMDLMLKLHRQIPN